MEPELSNHFTPADRREIIETGLNLKNLREDFLELKKAMEHRTSKDEQADLRVDDRIRALENFRWWILGASAGCGALFGLIGSKFFHP